MRTTTRAYRAINDDTTSCLMAEGSIELLSLGFSPSGVTMHGQLRHKAW